MEKSKKSIVNFLLFLVLIISISFLALAWSPQDDIDLKYRYNIVNDTAGNCLSGYIMQGRLQNGSWNCTLGTSFDSNETIRVDALEIRVTDLNDTFVAENSSIWNYFEQFYLKTEVEGLNDTLYRIDQIESMNDSIRSATSDTNETDRVDALELANVSTNLRITDLNGTFVAENTSIWNFFGQFYLSTETYNKSEIEGFNDTLYRIAQIEGINNTLQTNINIVATKLGGYFNTTEINNQFTTVNATIDNIQTELTEVGSNLTAENTSLWTYILAQAAKLGGYFNYTEIDNQMGKVNATADNIQTELTELTSNFTNQNTSTQARIDSLESANVSTNLRITDLNSTFVAENVTTNNNLSSINTDVNNVNTELDELGNNFTAQNTSTQAQITALESANVSVNERVTDANISAMHLDQDNWNNDTNGWIYWENPTIFFNSSLLDPVFHGADALQIVKGTLDDGALGDTNHTDGNYDGVSLNISEVSGAPGLDIRFNFTSMTKITDIILRVNDNANSQTVKCQTFD